MTLDKNSFFIVTRTEVAKPTGIFFFAEFKYVFLLFFLSGRVFKVTGG